MCNLDLDLVWLWIASPTPRGLFIKRLATQWWWYLARFYKLQSSGTKLKEAGMGLDLCGTVSPSFSTHSLPNIPGSFCPWSYFFLPFKSLCQAFDLSGHLTATEKGDIQACASIHKNLPNTRWWYLLQPLGKQGWETYLNTTITQQNAYSIKGNEVSCLQWLYRRKQMKVKELHR